MTAQAQTEATILELRAQLEAMSARLAQLESAATVAPAAAPDGNGKIGRRGLLTQALGAAAAATVLSVAKDAATAEAATNTTVIGPSTASYGLAAAPGVGVNPDTLIPGLGAFTFGVIGTVGSPGASPDRGAGVLGLSNSSGAGVFGRANSGTGVRGEVNTGDGVSGYVATGSGNGVVGATTGNQLASSGVYGIAISNQIGVTGLSNTDGIGVLGRCTGGPGVSGVSNSGSGVSGQALENNGIGVRGQGSGSAIGVQGESGGGSGVVGRTNTGVGVRGESTNASGFAGYFAGRVFIEGDFTALGIKSAAIKTNRQDLARVYCVEGTEAWLEDRGSARLGRNGRRIQIDDEFASTIRGDYHVTVTGYNTQNPLMVIDKDANGFRVVEQGNPDSNAEFSYCIWGKRKDIPNVRLDKVERKARGARYRPEAPVEDPQPISLPPIPESVIPRGRR